MVDVSFDQLHPWLTAFLWPFMRLSGFFLAAPLLGHSAVPNRVKIGLAALLCIVVAPALPPLPAATQVLPHRPRGGQVPCPRLPRLGQSVARRSQASFRLRLACLTWKYC